MYHWEFYSKIAQQIEPSGLVSGIIGDLWAGSVMTTAPRSPDDLLDLGYRHGLHADSKRAGLNSQTHRIQEYDEQKNNLIEPKRRIIYLVRTKLILLSYLLRVPEQIGFKPVTPYLTLDFAMQLLNLPEERRKNRVWQREFFKREGLNVENNAMRNSRMNSLDFENIRSSPPSMLDSNLLREVISSEYVSWINRNIQNIGKIGVLRHYASRLRYVSRIVRTLGIDDDVLEAYSAYLTIRPIQDALERRHIASKEN
jgi:hypothetical protein